MSKHFRQLSYVLGFVATATPICWGFVDPAHAATPAYYDEPVDEFCRIYCNCGRYDYGCREPFRDPYWGDDWGWDEGIAPGQYCGSIWCQYYCGPQRY